MGEVATAVTGLLNSLIAVSNTQSNNTASLVSAAQSALNSLQPPAVTLPLQLRTRQNAPRPRVPQPPEVDVDAYQPPEDVLLDPLQSLEDQFSEALPTLDLPAIELGTILPAGYGNDEPDYSFERWDMDYSTQPLTVEVGEEPASFPELSRPLLISAEPLSGTPPNVPAPSFKTFVLDYQTPYRESLDEVKDKIARLHQSLTDAKTAFDEGDMPFINLLVEAMNQEKWAIAYDEWAREVKHAEFQEVYAERYHALKKLDAQTPSITGMPSGQQVEALIKVEAEAAQKELQVLQKVEQTLRDKEFEFYKLALSIGANITDAAFSLRFQQIDLTQKAQQLVVSISKDIVDLIIRLIENKAQEFEYYARYNDAQVARNKLAMEVEKTKLEAIRADLGSNELALMYNENNARVYSLAMRLIEQRIDYRKIENDHLIYEKQVQLLELDYFTRELEQHNENLRLFLAKQGEAVADIKENSVILDGEILKSRNYRNSLTQQLANYKIEILNSKVVSENDRLKLSLYSEKNQGLIAELEALEEVSRVAVKAILLGVEAEALEKTLEAQQQELEDGNALYALRRNLKIEQLDLLNDIKQFSFNAERIKDQAQIMIQGASVAGGMATHAFSGLNGVITNIMTEFA